MIATLTTIAEAAADRLRSHPVFWENEAVPVLVIPWMSRRRNGLFWEHAGRAANSSWQLPQNLMTVAASPAPCHLALGYERVVHDCATCGTQAWMKLIAWQKSLDAINADVSLDAVMETAFTLLEGQTLPGTAGPLLVKEMRAGAADEIPTAGASGTDVMSLVLTLNCPLEFARIPAAATTPVIDNDGSFVTITADPGAAIYYSLDGSIPDKLTAPLYDSPIPSPAAGVTLRARAYLPGKLASPIAQL